MLGVNAQTCHKIIQLTLRRTADQPRNVKKPFKKFKHCTEEALLRVKGEVARKLKTLRLIRGDRKPKIYTYTKQNIPNCKSKIYWVQERTGGKGTSKTSGKNDAGKDKTSNRPNRKRKAKERREVFKHKAFRKTNTEIPNTRK